MPATQRLKRGPPYDDDALDSKFIVIEDPWPGDKVGDMRDAVFYNWLCAWVRFMLGKKCEPEFVYSQKKRNEVIVQLPLEADIVPILGAHPWRQILSRGEPKDERRVSYIFPYNYRVKGDPSTHNWMPNSPTKTGDPPKHIQFPVVYPYPHVSWATPKGKNCADISLPLPRGPTPERDTALFTPYQRPSQLTANTVNHAEPRDPAEETQVNPEANRKLNRIDPDEEDAHAVQSLTRTRGEPRLDNERRIKTESVKAEEQYVPSEDLVAAIEQLQRQSAKSQTHSASQTAERDDLNVKPKKEEAPYVPSDALVAAINELRSRPDLTTSSHENEAQSLSECLTATTVGLKRTRDDGGPHAAVRQIKQESDTTNSSSSGARGTDESGRDIRSPRTTTPPKRVNTGEHNVRAKRFKTEDRY